MSVSKASRVVLKGLEFDNAALELKKQAWTYQAIADELGVCIRTAYLGVDRSLKRLLKLNNGSAEEYRQMMLEQIDKTLKESFVIMAHDSDSLRLQAIDRIHRGLERKSKLLGLDIAKEESVATVKFEMVEGGILGVDKYELTGDTNA